MHKKSAVSMNVKVKVKEIEGELKEDGLSPYSVD
jgi:hypothetical protein